MLEAAWKVTEVYPDRNYSVQQTEGDLHIEFSDTRYSVVICTRRFTEIVPEHFYELSAEVTGNDLDYKVCFTWYDADDVEYAKGYLPEDGRILSPQGCSALEVEILITGTCGNLVAHTPNLKKIGLYEPRMVKVCTVAHELFNGTDEHTYSENIATVERQLDEVGKRCPDIIVLTECVFHTRVIPETGKAVPKTHMNSPEVKLLCKKARQYHTYIACSIKEEDSNGILHNTGLLIDRKGEISGIYRKSHLTIGEREAGIPYSDELPVFDTDFGRIGMQICWDHFFPESSRVLALRGAELLVMPTHGFLECRAMARAVDNGIYVATAYFWNDGTAIYAPDGTIVDKATGKGYAIAEIDLNKICYVRYLSCNSRGEPNDYYLHERRPELYALLTKGKA